jgi:hypothetical protein
VKKTLKIDKKAMFFSSNKAFSSTKPSHQFSSILIIERFLIGFQRGFLLALNDTGFSVLTIPQ